MLELVNTSLPNGLLPGTHGFATVAMSRTMPDSLRLRLEMLCAYRHRVTAHDESYYSQNPVNRFHLILPGSNHAVGLVRPCEFDYTGRTNRIARIRLFSTGEMPRVGGAEILGAGNDWFLQDWQGAPGFLEEDTAFPEEINRRNPAMCEDAPMWRETFRSPEYARRIAWHLENGIAAGKTTPVYFKFTPSWDPDGGKLLRLFSEIINSLPLEFRKEVTFSTYASSIPAGIDCHLRAICDDDPGFVAVSRHSPWVDCIGFCVKNESLLPQSAELKKNAATVPGARLASETKSASAAGKRCNRLQARKESHSHIAVKCPKKNRQWRE